MTRRTVCLSMGLLLLLLPLGSCTSDDYEKGDGEYSYMRADFVEAYSSKAGVLGSFVTDEGDSLVLSPRHDCSWASTPDSVYRALMYYSREDTASIKVRCITATQVLVLRVPQQRRDTVIMHPVGLESVWLSANGKYVNMGLDVKTGKGDDDKARQTLGVVCDTVLTMPDGNHEHCLRLFHDQGKVPEYYTSKVYVSIPLGNYSKGDVVRMDVNTYKGKVTKSFRIATNP